MKALVTTLPEAVGDNSLNKLGEINFYLRKQSNGTVRTFQFNVDSGIVANMRIVGDDYFTDSTGTSNLGKTRTYAATSTSGTVYVSNNNDCAVVIDNKYHIVGLQGSNGVVSYIYSDELIGLKAFRCTFGIEGNLEHLKYMTNVKPLEIYISHSDNLHGDISVLRELPSNIVEFETPGAPDIEGDISVLSDTNMVSFEVYAHEIKGNLSSISGVTSLRSLTLANSSVTGNISSLASLSDLTTLNLSNSPNITGDTSSLAGLTDLATFTYANTAITGTWPLT